MILSIFILIIAVIVFVVSLTQKPKYELPEEFKVLEEEINEFLSQSRVSPRTPVSTVSYVVRESEPPIIESGSLDLSYYREIPSSIETPNLSIKEEFEHWA